MSTIEVNKIVGAILVALLVMKVTDIIGNAVVHPEETGKVAYVVGGAGAAQAAVPHAAKPEKKELPPIAPLLAKASVDKGKADARKCAVCHHFAKGAGPKVGPPLWGVVDREKASISGFNYSSALKNLKGKWTYKDLNHFIADPRDYAPGTRMAFAGLRRAQDRADVIAFLRSLSDKPAPLP